MKTTRLVAALATAIALVAPTAASAAEFDNIALASRSTSYTGVLDTSGGSSAAGAKVIQNAVNGGTSQRWSFNDASQIVNLKSGLCLTTSGVAGQQLYLTYCNAANPRQIWAGRPQPLFYVAHDIYNPMTGLRIDVQGSSGLAGTPVIGWYDNDSLNQAFNYWTWS